MRERSNEIPPPKLITTLRNYNLLPAIVFMPTRRKCDEAATEVALDKSQKTDAEKQVLREELYQAHLAENPEIKLHKHRKILIRSGVAAHHAGHIPAWKLLIEKMMSKGLLNAIFATSTVAAGVDFPARTVVISNSEARGNDGWRTLRASELQQMTGRAGRRGKDQVGFVVLAPGQFQNPKKIAELLKSPPDDLQSKFRSTYTSLLNLLDAFKSFPQVREIAEKSFAFRETAQQIEKLESLRARIVAHLGDKIKKSGFDYTTEDLRGFERLTSARNRLTEKKPFSRSQMRAEWLGENVVSGRIVTQGRGGKRFFMVLTVNNEKVTAMRDDGQGAAFALDRVNRVYTNVYPLKDAAIEKAFFDVYEDKNPPLDEPSPSPQKTEPDETQEIFARALERFYPENASDEVRRSAAQFLWDAWSDTEYLEKSARDIEFLKSDIWIPFESRARVLNHFGYLDYAAETVTETGKWLADLRVDRPLLVGEALRLSIFDRLEPQIAAGLMASLAADADRNYGEIYLSDKLLDTLSDFEKIIYDVSGIEWKNGIQPAEEINYSAAAAAESWAGGMNWNELVVKTNAEEGDLIRLLSRTGEALLQIARLKEAAPQAAAAARHAAEVILREPLK